jgi:thioredoxin 1
MSVHEIDSIDMLNKIIDACTEVDKYLVIKAEAQWCGPCKAVKPRYKELAESYPNAVFVTFDVDDHQNIAEQFNISAMPTFIIIKERKVLKKVEGADLPTIRSVLDGRHMLLT